MSVEHISSPFEPEEEPQRSNFAIFIAGMGGTYKGNAPTEEALQRVYGEENVRIFNSQISTDGPDPKKFADIGQVLEEKIRSGANVDVLVNSLGGVEFYEAIKVIEQRSPDFFFREEHLSKMDVTLISPAGFMEGMKGNLSFVRNLAAFIHEETPTPLIGSLESVRGGIASINTLPPSEIPREVLVDGLRSALNDLSQMEEGFEEVDFVPDHEFADEVGDEDRQELELTDLSLAAAIDMRNENGVREMLKRRGKLLAPYTLKKFAGEHVENFPDSETLSWTPGAVWGTLNLLKDMVAGEPINKIDELRKRGMNVTFAVPEYDVLFPLEEVKQFFDSEEDAQENTVILPSTTHNSFVLAPESVSKLMSQLRGTV